MGELRRKTFLTIVAVAMACAVAELAMSCLVFTDNSPLTGMREFILDPDRQPLYLPVPFINYINMPGRRDPDGMAQVNSLGLRNREPVAIPKSDSTVRILFLGGSTTFGEVDYPEQAFPSLIERKLNGSEGLLSPKYVHAECLNAGLGAATSAELLIHFMLRHRYLDSDLVVIHSGINDAFAYARVPGYVYQPDYHTSKRAMREMPEVTPLMAGLCRSRLLSAVLIPFRFPRQSDADLHDNDFFRYHGEHLWLDITTDSMFSPRYNAYYNNLGAIVTHLQANGIPVLMVTEVVEYGMMPDGIKGMLHGGIEVNNSLMLQLGRELSVPVITLNKEHFPAELFHANDGIHLNERGEEVIAGILTPAIIEMVRGEIDIPRNR